MRAIRESIETITIKNMSESRRLEYLISSFGQTWRKVSYSNKKVPALVSRAGTQFRRNVTGY